MTLVSICNIILIKSVLFKKSLFFFKFFSRLRIYFIFNPATAERSGDGLLPAKQRSLSDVQRVISRLLHVSEPTHLTAQFLCTAKKREPARLRSRPLATRRDLATSFLYVFPPAAGGQTSDIVYTLRSCCVHVYNYNISPIVSSVCCAVPFHAMSQVRLRSMFSQGSHLPSINCCLPFKILTWRIREQCNLYLIYDVHWLTQYLWANPIIKSQSGIDQRLVKTLP